ncbi:uncharacterized protein LOC117316958 [Pecten maximus]|uniref:uncharacterized protein LOC117316958 n=1 Tax=Pecten maximus TaxID=6579 RepID=UPI001458E0AA|nr:uncharacterized protein LOC117316958 [Pecten maximus]
MCLPFLPSEQIVETVMRLDDRVTSPALASLMDYIDRTWIRSRTFPVSSSSIFMSPIRTNNDVEGWHNRLNSRVNIRGPVPFYLLLQELFREATAIPLQSKMVCENKLARYQRKKTRDIQREVFRLWGQYTDGEVSTSQLMRRIGRLLH